MSKAIKRSITIYRQKAILHSVMAKKAKILSAKSLSATAVSSSAVGGFTFQKIPRMYSNSTNHLDIIGISKFVLMEML